MGLGDGKHRPKHLTQTPQIAPVEIVTHKGAHPDYGRRSFALRNGDILGRDRDGTRVFPLVDYEGGASSWLKVERSNKRAHKAMRFREARDYLWVILPQKDFDRWITVQKISRQIDANVTSPAFVFAAVTYAIGRIKDEKSLYDDEDGYGWAKALHSQLTAMAVDLDAAEPHEVAQQLLQWPVSRVCETVLSTLNAAPDEE